MQDYRRQETNRLVSIGCAGFMILVGVGLLGLMAAASVALLR